MTILNTFDALLPFFYLAYTGFLINTYKLYSMEFLTKQEIAMHSQTGHGQCPHHWIIDSSEGVTSYGKCSLCGMTKEFINDWETAINRINKDTSDYTFEGRG